MEKYKKTEEKAIIVGINSPNSEYDAESYFAELEQLVNASGRNVVASVQQNRNSLSGSTYIGKGKLEELKGLVEHLNPDVLIFAHELSPAQIRNLEKELDLPLIDRTMLILDIFRQRAFSKEGKLQVELARLEYNLPRLSGSGRGLSRIGSGSGLSTRGAGEQKLEMDRRRLRKRIIDIKFSLKKAASIRSQQSKKRTKSSLPLVSMVGYTNAGKSTLFNTICSTKHKSGTMQVDADDRLFQTLETSIRKVRLDSGYEFLLSDTVGFIQNLPPALIMAFRSTLEEAINADLILHVIDFSDPLYLNKMVTVEEYLRDLGADKEKIINVFNKVDLIEDDIDCLSQNEVFISAKDNRGIEDLLQLIAEHKFEKFMQA